MFQDIFSKQTGNMAVAQNATITFLHNNDCILIRSACVLLIGSLLET